jgi:hypothetical protein
MAAVRRSREARLRQQHLAAPSVDSEGAVSSVGPTMALDGAVANLQRSPALVCRVLPPYLPRAYRPPCRAESLCVVRRYVVRLSRSRLAVGDDLPSLADCRYLLDQLGSVVLAGQNLMNRPRAI